MSPEAPNTDDLHISSDAAILGLDNVPLALPIAGIGSRTLAAVVDYMFLIVLMGLWWSAGLLTLSAIGFSQGWMIALLSFGSFLIQWSYFAVLEIVMQGQTPGKNTVGLRVVSYQGGRTSAGPILMRNLIRTVDVIVGVPVMALDLRSRRLGDMAGGTLVIHERPPSAGEELELRRVPASWGPEEIVVVESFLRRAERMEPGRAQNLAEKLLLWIGERESDFVTAAGETEAFRQLEPVAGQRAFDRVALLRRLLQAEAA